MRIMMTCWRYLCCYDEEGDGGDYCYYDCYCCCCDGYGGYCSDGCDDYYSLKQYDPKCGCSIIRLLLI